MKSQKGITLVALTVYIIVMTMVVAMVSMLSTYFYSNTKSVSESLSPLTEYTKFNSFFSDEVNHSGLHVLDCQTIYEDNDETGNIQSSYVVFDNGVQYSYVPENKAIYRNKVKVCSNVENCIFEVKMKNGKDVISVTIKIEKAETKSVDYTLKN